MTNHNWPVTGHDWAVEFLRRSMANRRNRHAYLITGTSNVGKKQFAHAFAMALNCTHEDEAMRPCQQCRSCRLISSGNHPDMIYAEHDPRTNALKIDALRDLMQKLALKPYDSRYRIAMIIDFHEARPQAQDALLKTLEEPSKHAVLLLMAPTAENILPTITSRCQIIPLRSVPSEQVRNFLLQQGADAERAALLARLSGGRIGWALEALKNEVVLQERDEMLNLLLDVINGTRARRFEIAEQLEKIAKDDKLALQYLLEMWQTYWRDVLLLSEGSPVKPSNTDRHIEIQQLVQRIQPGSALKALQSTRQMLQKTIHTNANTRMALEVLFLDYPGL